MFSHYYRLVENKVALAYVVKPREQYHACDHGDIIRRFLRQVHAVKQEKNQRFCHAERDQVTYRDIRHEFQCRQPEADFVAECKTPVHKKAKNACRYVSNRAWYPITEIGEVVQAVHDRRAKQRIQYADEKKFQHFRIEQFSALH